MSNIEMMKEDLAIQKKKLEDLKTWNSVSILIEAQKKIVDKLEKRLEAMKDNEVSTDDQIGNMTIEDYRKMMKSV